MVLDIAAVIVDCQHAAPMAAFYQAACGGEVIQSDGDSAWLRVGGTTVIFREVEDDQAPTWPSPNIPIQIHLDFLVDDVDEAEALLQQLGATTAEHQPHRDNGLVAVFVDARAPGRPERGVEPG